MSAWKELARAHLKEHRPKLYRELEASGDLESFLEDRREAASRVLDEYLSRGLSYDQGWEAASRELFLPSEEDVPLLGEEPRPY